MKQLPPIERIVFDFDNTLFDTERRREYFYEMVELHGYSREAAYAMYLETRVAQEKIFISLASFLTTLKRKLNQDGKTFLSEEVSQKIVEMNAGDGLLPGARSLLEQCVKLTVPLYLLSLGVREWQEEKVQQSGIGKFFPRDHIIYTDRIHGGKETALRDLFGASFDGAGTLVVNDKPDETERLLETFPRLSACLKIEARDPRINQAQYALVAERFSSRAVVAAELADVARIIAESYVKQ